MTLPWKKPIRLQPQWDNEGKRCLDSFIPTAAAFSPHYMRSALAEILPSTCILKIQNTVPCSLALKWGTCLASGRWGQIMRGLNPPNKHYWNSSSFLRIHTEFAAVTPAPVGPQGISSHPGQMRVMFTSSSDTWHSSILLICGHVVNIPEKMS